MFPSLYQAHYSRHTEDLDFWLGLAGQYGSPLFELGCGTGRVLLPLGAAGHQAFGLDHDFGMLSVLHAAASSPGSPQVYTWQGDMSRLPVQRILRLILVPCNTYSTLRAEERQATVQEAARCLLPGGAFAFAVPNPALLQKMPRQGEEEIEEVFQHPTQADPVQVSSAWERQKGIFTIFWNYDILLPGGNMERTRVEARHYITPVETYLDELRSAGFKDLQLFGDFDHSTFQARSDILIGVATR